MRRLSLFGLLGLAIPFAVSTAPPAAAECVNAGGSTVCAQGTVRGGGPEPPTAGPYVPYPCEYDWYCQGGGLDIIIGGGDIDWGRRAARAGRQFNFDSTSNKEPRCFPV
ncbi:hypothetical protein LOC73_02530 [Mycolicibacterium mageritense]|nr:hypothetical protein [Mycolicibacterium mageritense]MCC9179699.1 hypothetical protein [Mycolicibacterium mageritense]